MRCGNYYTMNKDQKKFWNILREPYIKNCLNCKYNRQDFCGMGRRSFCWNHNKKKFAYWKWNEK